MRTAIYTVKIKGSNVEKILEEIDKFFIKLEGKYSNVQIST
jgi:hypothetical protein